MKLSVGCGRMPAAQNLTRLDKSPLVKPDIVWDINVRPLPFADSSFDVIDCLDVIEHLLNIPSTIEEFHRILKPQGLLRITTPHFSCANSYVDPTHRWHLSRFSFDCFSEGHDLSYYSSARFRIKGSHIQFDGGRIKRSLVSRLANKYPAFYEKRMAWLVPAWFLYFELEALKADH